MQGKVFWVEDRRVENFTYGRKMSRDAWQKRIHLGQVDADYAPEDEFYDAVVISRQSQYDVVG